MAKKKVPVKKKSLMAAIESTKMPYEAMPSAKTGPIGPGIPSAHTGQIGPDLIGANIGKAQQIDAVEQAQMTDRLREKAKERLAAKKASGAADSAAPAAKAAPAQAPAKKKKAIKVKPYKMMSVDEAIAARNAKLAEREKKK